MRRYKFKFLQYDTKCFTQRLAVKMVGLEEIKDQHTLDIIERLIPKGAWRPGIFYLPRFREPWNQITYPGINNCFVYFKGAWYWYSIHLEFDLYSYREPSKSEWAAMKILGAWKLSKYQQKVYYWWLWEYERRAIKVDMGLQGYKMLDILPPSQRSLTGDSPRITS
jgi:hypothetical protein